MELMAETPDGFYDLSCVDPPYGIGEDGRNNHTRGKLAKSRSYKDNARYDNEPPPPEYFTELKRVSKKQIIWGANHFLDNFEFEKNASCWVIWDKENGATDFADCEMAWTNIEKATRLFRYRWHGMLQADMKNKERRQHPNQKPVALYKWLLENYTKPGDRILDTHGGSMSIALACYDLGFDLDLCELDPDYFAAGKARFERHVNRWHSGMDTAIIDKTDCPEIGLFANNTING